MPRPPQQLVTIAMLLQKPFLMSLLTWHANETAPCNKNSAHDVPRRQLWQLLKNLPFEGGVFSWMAMAIIVLVFLI